MSGLANGTRYHFRLRATNAEGDGTAAQTTIQLAATPAATVTISDAALRTALERNLGKSAGVPITQLDMAKLTTVRASFRGITSLVGMEQAVNLSRLGLRFNSISDVSALGTLTSLTVLWLQNNAISDVSALGALTSLTELRLGNNAISDVSALASLTSLTVLTLQNNSISDISSFGTLTSLTELELGGNSITDVSALGTLTSLTNLGLGFNSISDVSALGTLTSLVFLHLDANSISDVSALGTLTSLTTLWLGGNSIADVSALGTLTSLMDLSLGGNSISDISALATLTSLTVLTLQNNSISDMSGLRNLAALWFLELQGNTIAGLGSFADGTAFSNPGGASEGRFSFTLGEFVLPSDGPFLDLTGQALTADSVYVHIPALQARGVKVLFDAPVIASFADTGLRGTVERTLGKSGGATLTQGDLLGLRTLHAAGAGVEDLAGIEMAVHLDWLDLSGNRLEDVGALASLPSLGWLDLSDNGLADVSALSGLASLRTLLLGGNALADVSPLSNLTRLRSLVLSDNELEDVSPLSSLVGLEQLWLAGNRLADVAPFAGLTSLRYLHLGGNRVADVSPLRGLRALKRLWLNDNALANLAPVLGLRSLVWLDAAGNRVADVRLNGAPLQRLRLDDNLIENVDGLVNSRLGEGDVVGLRGNPLSAASVETHVPALRKRGVAVLAGRPVPLFPSAADASGRVGFVRVLNRSDRTGNVLISAVDDAGERFGPVRLTIAAGAAAHLNSKDLEAGNAAKGLHAGVGARSVAGDWRVELLSTLDIAVLAYVRTPDGFLTAMHGTLPRANGGESLRASFFNPGRNRAQRSVLRLLNPGGVEEPVSVWGVDDSGAGRLATGLTVPAGGALTVDAAKLERPRAGESWRGLGRGEGKWRLRVSTRWPVEAANLLESPSGHLANLSAVPRADADGTWRTPLFPAADDAAGRQGFVRIANHNARTGEVRIWATDDNGHRRPVALALDASATVHLNSGDLERGSAAKGLPVGVGAPTRGDWRLALASDLNIHVASYIRHADGFVTSMHDLAPWNETNSSARVVFFNPASNRNQRSLLRLMNDGAEAANVVIAGVDDKAELGGEVGVTVPAGEAVTISAKELEDGGERLEGALGDGAGKWRLTVTADHPVGVMSLLESPTGHLSNLSSAGDGG